MIAQISLEEYFFQKSEHTKPSESKYFTAVQIKAPRPRHRKVVVSPGTVGNLAVTYLASFDNYHLTPKNYRFDLLIRNIGDF
jgi:hypothetical protein